MLKMCGSQAASVGGKPEQDTRPINVTEKALANKIETIQTEQNKACKLNEKCNCISHRANK